MGGGIIDDEIVRRGCGTGANLPAMHFFAQGAGYPVGQPIRTDRHRAIIVCGTATKDPIPLTHNPDAPPKTSQKLYNPRETKTG